MSISKKKKAATKEKSPPSFPLTILWPADLPVAVIAGRWRRLEDGMIEATYNSQEELRLALELTRLAKEISPLPSTED